MKRRVFYSFHYQADSWRASMVRNIGSIEGNKPGSPQTGVGRGGASSIPPQPEDSIEMSAP